jgi:outer membrane biosynthesis protein TonB
VRRLFGPRTAIEAVFLVAVPVVVLLAGENPAVIIASSAVAYLAVIVFEGLLWRNRPQQPAEAAAGAAEPAPALPDTVRVLPPPAADARLVPPLAPEVAAPEAAAAPEPEPEPEPAPEPQAAVAEEPVRVLRPVPTPVPEPIAEPEPELPPAAVAPPAVVPIGVSASPRQWNLWDLERLSREHAGQDDVRDEERSFLLLYLRDFAGPDGLLPIDFDGLVRDSFGDLVGAR